MAFLFSTHDDRPIILGYKFEPTLATRQEGVDSKRPLEQVRGLRKSLLARSADGSSLRYVAPLPDRAATFCIFIQPITATMETIVTCLSVPTSHDVLVFSYFFYYKVSWD